ncbi:N-acetyl-gamma-glutamyl-phosphate reductase [Atopomonas hussainii]|uniref:N-acetyl-gamma-glutamyl-phosphate reductase n=1 Tax=Atopomonas hussainii TaxID=1429083 RepID=A0A1H7QPU9_9GAMM|nr:N-acetyl-gamma-glutamyl-phosphate reductase [Atopomonas hussainii]SEL49307.1 N-acetyl-gamma-glutamyl-phosphate reductase [Atopomonas hussainii]
MIKVGIVGGTGYTGVELLRLLVQHPDVQLEVITSRSEAGLPVADMYPNLRGHLDLAFSQPDVNTLKQCDLVFFATPNGIAMQQVPELLEAGVKVVDLAADFRLSDPAVWEKWYGMPHACENILAEAVYGLPEINRAKVREARLVANPGCYPTAVQLGFLPLVEQGLIRGDLVADCKSGVSGAGRQTHLGSLLCEASENFKAYGVPGHRHLPEIRQGLARAAGHEIGLTFVPHLTPMIRGIHATLYAQVPDRSVDLQALYEQRYANEVFVDVMPAGSHPETRSVKGSNRCRIAIHRPQDGDTVVILSAIDNLVKGAAGQAVHNMNLMFGLDEQAGLGHVALLP